MELYSPAEKLVPTMDLAGEFNHFLCSVQTSHANYILTEKHVVCQSCQYNGNPSEIPWGATKNKDMRSWPQNKASLLATLQPILGSPCCLEFELSSPDFQTCLTAGKTPRCKMLIIINQQL